MLDKVVTQFGVQGDLRGKPGTQTGIMGNPWAPQRREPMTPPILDCFFNFWQQHETRGDARPVQGQLEYLSNGMPGGRPLPPPMGLQAPLQKIPMLRMNREDYRTARQAQERVLRAARMVNKPVISKLPDPNKRGGLDFAFSLRMRPGLYGKPMPPEPFKGGAARIFQTDRTYPKNTRVSMQPIRRNPWGSWMP